MRMAVFNCERCAHRSMPAARWLSSTRNEALVLEDRSRHRPTRRRDLRSVPGSLVGWVSHPFKAFSTVFGCDRER